ncbi:hypothetical protein KCU57_13265 [Xanthomonas translucens]|uniref:hypothetical protein n=1 Tax=Xanthomonas campestris pv. translucens TaxID=343 RepID=UPI001F298A63|nr:hypothetical protein [Xanthomonas translucens]UKE49724.1 hypothetical protein KCU57_13265 [Xanthomonas translucens]
MAVGVRKWRDAEDRRRDGQAQRWRLRKKSLSRRRGRGAGVLPVCCVLPRDQRLREVVGTN